MKSLCSTALRVLGLEAIISGVFALSPTVTIPAGIIVGTSTLLPGATGEVNQFFGIPYAISPPKRFSPPEEPLPWSTPLRAKRFRDACFQQFNVPADTLRYLYDNPGGEPATESEDCLYLNLYIPPGTTKGDGKAVIVNFFGGNYVFGYGTIDYCDGSSWAYNQDIIIVTFNARTGAFGFSGSPQIEPQDNNAGLWDQRAVVQWVQNNIEYFGGDPGRVTIMGQSSGGYSVKQLVAYPPDPLPFHAAIAMSEGAGTTGDPKEAWANLTATLGCDISPDPLECVRGENATRIKEIAETFALPFFPSDDGITHAADVYPRFRYRQIAKVPLMTGSTRDETRSAIWAQGIGTNSTIQSLGQFLQQLFPNNFVLQKTLALLFAGQPLFYSASAISTFFVYQCKCAKLAQAAHSAGLQTYRYLYQPSFENLQRFPNAGSWHSSDVPVLWGNVYQQWGPATEQELALTTYLQETWANFAKDPSQAPQSNWPEYGPLGMILSIGANGGSGGQAVLGAHLDTLCQTLSVVVNTLGL